jgi:ClpP class serine protease
MNQHRLLLHEIVRSPWMIEGQTAEALRPLVNAFLSGQIPDKSMYLEWGEDEKLSDILVDENFDFHWRPSQTKNNLVSIGEFFGVLSMYNSSMGYGSRSQANYLKAMDAAPNVVAHIGHFNTPGGSAAGLKVSSNTIAQLQKPKVGFIDYMCASAGMYMIGPFDEIYASDENDITGSIGTVISWTDYKGMVKKDGGKAHEVYAKQSTRKNEEFRLAEKDPDNPDYSLIHENILTPHMKEFESQMRKNLPSLEHLPKEEQDWLFSGPVFPASKGVSFGMINGIRSFESAIERAFELGHAWQKANSKNKKYIVQ